MMALFFGSDEDEKHDEGKRQTEECLTQHRSKKTKKPGLVAMHSGCEILGWWVSGSKIRGIC